MKKVSYFLVIVFFFMFVINVRAETYTYRVKILNNKTNLRNDAGGTDGTRVALLYAGDYYTLVTNTLHEDVNNHKRCIGGWYEMTYYTGTTGYVCQDDVELIVSYSTDDIEPTTECEQEMSNAGFPSSYWGGLCALKENHPTWQFQAVDTGLDWTYVVESESICGVNYISSSTLDSTFFDSTCTSTSPGGYVAPSQKAVAFYMDPRNFFTEKYIFQFLDLSYDSTFDSIYSNSVSSIISGTSFYKYHQSIGNDLTSIVVSGSKENLISPISIASRIKQELGNGDSLYNLYSGIYDGYDNLYYGYYNFYNFGVSDSCVATNGTTYCGLYYAYRMGWNSVSSAISGGAYQLAVNYIQKGQYTGYFQKYNVVPTNSNSLFIHQYMTNVAAPMSEAQTTYNAYKDNNLLSENLVFKIPVYSNMSATINNSDNGAVDDGNNDASPSTIAISTIVTSSGYRYSSSYIANIAVGTDVSTVKSTLESVGGNATVSITDASGNALSSGIVATGYKVTINNQSSTETLTMVIKGDTSGDGVINALDLLQVQKNILGTYTLSGAYFEAGDTSADGTINALDLLQVQKSILGTYSIVQ